MMRRIIAVIAVVVVAAAWGRPAASEDGIAVYFSPRGGCTTAIPLRTRAWMAGHLHVVRLRWR